MTFTVVFIFFLTCCFLLAVVCLLFLLLCVALLAGCVCVACCALLSVLALLALLALFCFALISLRVFSLVDHAIALAVLLELVVMGTVRSFFFARCATLPKTQHWLALTQ